MPTWISRATLIHSVTNWSNTLRLPAGSSNPHSSHFNQAMSFCGFLIWKLCTPKHRLNSALSWTNTVSLGWNCSWTRFSEKSVIDFCPWTLKWVIGLHLRENLSPWITVRCGSTGQSRLSLASTQLCVFEHALAHGWWQGSGSVAAMCQTCLCTKAACTAWPENLQALQKYPYGITAKWQRSLVLFQPYCLCARTVNLHF